MGRFSSHLVSNRGRSSVVDTKGLEIRRVSVQSSNIKSIGYDQISRLLVVEFLSGSVYEYYNVPLEIYAQLKTPNRWGGSYGKAFYALIKKGSRFPYRLLRRAG